MTKCFEQIFGFADTYDRVDNGLVINLSVRLGFALVEQLLYDIGKLLGQTFAYLRARIFNGDGTRHFHHLHEATFVQFVHQLTFGLMAVLQPLLGIVNHSAKRTFLFLRQRITVDVIHFSADNSGCIFNHVQECRISSVQITQEMLRTFRHGKDCLKIYYLGSHSRFVRIFFTKKS